MRWLADRAGFRILSLADDLRQGFDEIDISLHDDFYGASTRFDTPHFGWTHKKAVSEGLISADFPRPYYEKMVRIAADMAERSKDEGFRFFNGAVLRLHSLTPDPRRPSLHLQPSSYFTALGDMPTGYRYRRLGYPPELPFAPEQMWANADDWQQALTQAKLANPFSVQLVLYNDEECFYCLRGRVAFGQAVLTGTASGYCEPMGDAHVVRATLKKEASEELGIDLSDSDLHVLAIGTRRSDCGTLALATARTSLSRAELRQSIESALEGNEIAELLGFNWQQALATPELLEQALAEKLIGRWEPGGYVWNSIGPTTLMLTLAHLDPDAVDTAIRRIERRWSSVGRAASDY